MYPFWMLYKQIGWTLILHNYKIKRNQNIMKILGDVCIIRVSHHKISNLGIVAKGLLSLRIDKLKYFILLPLRCSNVFLNIIIIVKLHKAWKHINTSYNF